MMEAALVSICWFPGRLLTLFVVVSAGKYADKYGKYGDSSDYYYGSSKYGKDYEVSTEVNRLILCILLTLQHRTSLLATTVCLQNHLVAAPVSLQHRFACTTAVAAPAGLQHHFTAPSAPVSLHHSDELLVHQGQPFCNHSCAY
jgi:hypothetical protein